MLIVANNTQRSPLWSMKIRYIRYMESCANFLASVGPAAAFVDRTSAEKVLVLLLEYCSISKDQTHARRHSIRRGFLTRE
jgi:predicted naringenin-chalcone synthase